MMEKVLCNPSPDCKYFPGCHGDIHHKWFPRKDYRTSLEKQFRQDSRNKVLSCRRLHDEEHAGNPPPKPDREFMLRFLGGLGTR